MRTILKAALVGAAWLSLATASLADTVQLKSGAILVGEIELTENGDIEITTRFPKEEVFTLKREDLVPRSLYDVLDRRSNPKDADTRLQLGELAESAGLFGIAISDYMAVAGLRPDLQKEMTERIEKVREAIAAGILADARELLDQGNPRGALMYLHTIEERYGKTRAAKEAKKLMATGYSRAGSSADVAKKTISAKKAPKLIASIEKDLAKGDREARKLTGHEGLSSRDSKVADRAIHYFELAWKKIKTLPVAAMDAELQAKIEHLRKSGKQRLAQAYLTAGSIHLQRYSIPRAEEYCNKVCELQPEDKSNHKLHELIIQAKIYNGGYGRFGI